RAGEWITGEVPTHVAAVVKFVRGALATLVTSFDVWKSNAPGLEIHGSDGSLSLPVTFMFGGAVHLHRAGETAWKETPLLPGYTADSRGIGVAEMAAALRHRPHLQRPGQLVQPPRYSSWVGHRILQA